MPPTARTAPAVFTFAVYPSDFGSAFEGFLLEVPTLSDEDAAARRAWWSAFHLLGPKGIEPADFAVCCWRDGSPGPAVNQAGVVS